MTIPIFGWCTGTSSAISRTTPSWKALHTTFVTLHARRGLRAWIRPRGEHKDREREREEGKDRFRLLSRSKREIPRGRDGAALSNSPSTARHVGWSRPDFAKYGITNALTYVCACPGRCNISQYNTRRWRQGTPRYSAARLELHLTTTKSLLSNSCANGRSTALKGAAAYADFDVLQETYAK